MAANQRYTMHHVMRIRPEESKSIAGSGSLEPCGTSVDAKRKLIRTLREMIGLKYINSNHSFSTRHMSSDFKSSTGNIDAKSQFRVRLCGQSGVIHVHVSCT
jgi:hypothetical protein